MLSIVLQQLSVSQTGKLSKSLRFTSDINILERHVILFGFVSFLCVSGAPYCDADSNGVEKVCLNMDLDGTLGVLTCHACGYMAGEPCCVDKDGDAFCVPSNTECFSLGLEGDVGFEAGIKGECECNEISMADAEDGLCVTDCTCAGCDCCIPDDGCALSLLFLFSFVTVLLSSDGKSCWSFSMLSPEIRNNNRVHWSI